MLRTRAPNGHFVISCRTSPSASAQRFAPRPCADRRVSARPSRANDRPLLRPRPSVLSSHKQPYVPFALVLPASEDGVIQLVVAFLRCAGQDVIRGRVIGDHSNRDLAFDDLRRYKPVECFTAGPKHEGPLAAPGLVVK